MSKFKNSKKTFFTVKDANKYILSKKGECVVVPYRDKFKVRYERALNESKPQPQKYCTIKFSSIGAATGFCKRVKREGFETNVNQDINVKTISETHYQVRFILTKPKVYTKRQDHDDDWMEANIDGSFAYNGATDDF